MWLNVRKAFRAAPACSHDGRDSGLGIGDSEEHLVLSPFTQLSVDTLMSQQSAFPNLESPIPNPGSTDIVLAFSGGLDTSFCVPWLQERGWAVHTVFADTGGVDAEESQEERRGGKEGVRPCRSRWAPNP